jgi:CBS domain-containing membrane protein
MSKQVVVLSEKSAITHLIALFSMQGHAQIPIINADKKLVGMVYQSDLIKVLNDKMVLKNTTE